MISTLGTIAVGESLGGKGTNLSIMRAHGLNVPPGFVITSDEFSNHSQQLIDLFVSQDINIDHLSGAEVLSLLDAGLIVEICEAMQIVSMPVAVRSSSEREDSSNFSYAGQFETYLNISSFEEVIRAVVKCWLSAFSEKSAAYSRELAKEPRIAPIAVIVQSMIQSNFAGVAFTVEPQFHSPGIAMTEWVQGLGETLVSGNRIDGRAYVRLDTSQVLMIDHQADAPAPPSALWPELVTLLSKVSALLGPKQDVEWAWCNGELYVLQSRPITTAAVDIAATDFMPGWLLPGRPRGGWTAAHRCVFDLWDEYNNPVVMPLDYDLHIGAIWQASIDMLQISEWAPRIEQCVVMECRVPIAIDPAGRVTEQAAPSLGTKMGDDLSLALEAVATKVSQIETRLAISPLLSIPDLDMFTLIERVAEIYRDIATTRLLKMHTWITATDNAQEEIRPLLESLGIVKIEQAFDLLTASVQHASHEYQEGVEELTRLSAQGANIEWRLALENFLLRFGHFEIAGQFIAEERKVLERLVANMSLGQSVKSRSNVIQESLEFQKTVEDSLPVDLRQKFRQTLNLLHSATVLRENTKTGQNKPLLLLTRLLNEIGRRFVERGFVSNTEDVKLYRLNELRACLTGGRCISEETLTLRRSLVRKKLLSRWLPPSFRAKPFTQDDNQLVGTPASTGKCEGIARVVNTLEELGTLRQGEILIARATNPAWTSSFNLVKGIVVENGTITSHAVITAREYRIPAVVGVPGLLSAINTGERLRVDGDRGLIDRVPTAQRLTS